MKFLRFFASKLPERHKQFDLSKGRLCTKRIQYLLVSIKDPFIKSFNHGHKLKEKEKLTILLAKIKNLMKAISTNSLHQFIN